jgi:hypothetical protein
VSFQPFQPFLLGPVSNLLPEELRAPRFVREMAKRNDFIEKRYWARAITDLRAAVAAEDPDRCRAVLSKLYEDGHAAEVQEILDHRDRVRAFFAAADEVEIGIITVRGRDW